VNPTVLEVTRCMLCASLVKPGAAPVYALDEDAVLCFHCAVQRGGTYDDARRTWVALPCCSGLPPSERQRNGRPYFAQRLAG
jgi:hypothetical protein